jgi:hypothetical protein
MRWKRENRRQSDVARVGRRRRRAKGGRLEGKGGRRRRHQENKTLIHKHRREKRSNDAKQLSFILDVIRCNDVSNSEYLCDNHEENHSCTKSHEDQIPFLALKYLVLR